jgi:inner membrane protein
MAGRDGEGCPQDTRGPPAIAKPAGTGQNVPARSDDWMEMDPLAHTLVGATLGQAGLKRRTRYGMATLLVGANLPDVDILSSLTDTTLAFRRGWTHGVLAMAVLPLVLTGLVVLWGRWRAGRRAPDAPPGDSPLIPRQVWLLATLALLTHPFLDWLNVYGVRLLMPFSGRWFYGDSLFILDPVLWVVLLVGSVWSAIRWRRGWERPARPARWSLGAAVTYIAVMITLTQAGRYVTTKELSLERDPGPRAMMVDPPFLRPWRRDVTLSVADRYWFGEIEWLPRPGLNLDGNSVMKAFDEPRLDLVEPTPQSEQLLAWARFPYYFVEGERGRRWLRLDDARYGKGRRSWAAVIWPLN